MPPVWARASRSGRVSRQRPSLTRRSRARSSGVTVGALIGRHSARADGEVVGFAGEAPGDDGAGHDGCVVAVLGAAFEHAADEPDVDLLVVQARCAGGVGPRGPTS